MPAQRSKEALAHAHRVGSCPGKDHSLIVTIAHLAFRIAQFASVVASALQNPANKALLNDKCEM
jgi:hypothetical protein